MHGRVLGWEGIGIGRYWDWRSGGNGFGMAVRRCGILVIMGWGIRIPMCTAAGPSRVDVCACNLLLQVVSISFYFFKYNLPKP